MNREKQKELMIPRDNYNQRNWSLEHCSASSCAELSQKVDFYIDGKSPELSCHVQEGEYPNRLDPQNPVYAEETSPSVIVNGFSERLRASHIQRIRPHSENLKSDSLFKVVTVSNILTKEGCLVPSARAVNHLLPGLKWLPTDPRNTESAFSRALTRFAASSWRPRPAEGAQRDRHASARDFAFARVSWPSARPVPGRLRRTEG
ncbi:hypothetical protein U0070_013840 [Myodes glareolus]|uniref:Uncharacterized protein n=1 Tax=Myodes glareolus TaxID=447135 RepID=A0AAW0IE32_MYOGA